MKLPKTIRLDISDQNTFPLAAEAGEWAVTGTFSFSGLNAEGMSNKEQLAFRNGWLGLGSFGRASLVQVSPVSEDEYEQIVRALAAHLHCDYNAPDMMAALDAARIEVSDAEGICNHPPGTMLAIDRELTDEGIVERIHVIPPGHDDHARIWTIEDDEQD